jgi:MoaA/NifB/PqqE/SkfB family radical SAM enzyme
MIDPTKLELEITSKCTLFCPECPRTKDPDEIYHKWKHGEVDISVVEKMMQVPGLRNVIFSGAYGDPIYHTKFIEIIEIVKKAGKQITVNTNGSYRSAAWWERLALLFDDNDLFVFSVDGLPGKDLYRINSNWPSIETGIKIMTSQSKARIQWKWIIFKYNENDGIEGYNLSRQLGVGEFVVVSSGRNYPPGYKPDRTLEEVIGELNEYMQGAQHEIRSRVL